MKRKKNVVPESIGGEVVNFNNLGGIYVISITCEFKYLKSPKPSIEWTDTDGGEDDGGGRGCNEVRGEGME